VSNEYLRFSDRATLLDDLIRQALTYVPGLPLINRWKHWSIRTREAAGVTECQVRVLIAGMDRPYRARCEMPADGTVPDRGRIEVWYGDETDVRWVFDWWLVNNGTEISIQPRPIMRMVLVTDGQPDPRELGVWWTSSTTNLTRERQREIADGLDVGLAPMGSYERGIYVQEGRPGCWSFVRLFRVSATRSVRATI
jgi:hypothetical protein